jgi:hypothetical protein
MSHKCCCSGGGHTIPGCPCTGICDPLTMHVTNVFPPGSVLQQYLVPATLTWQPKPADVSTYGVGNPGYFSDVVTLYNNGTPPSPQRIGRYTLSCVGGTVYTIQLLLVPSSPSYPAIISLLGWSIGGGGSTCSPFKLNNIISYNSGLSVPINLQGTTIDCFPDLPPPPVVIPPNRAAMRALAAGGVVGSGGLTGGGRFRLTEAAPIDPGD